MQTAATDSDLRFTPQLLMGLFIVIVGIVFTLDNLGMAEAERYVRYWPLGLIAVGSLKVWQSRGGGAFVGLLFIIAGTWLLLESLDIVNVPFWRMWPLLLVLFGASMIWQGVRGGRRLAAAADTNDTLSALALLGGMNRGNNSRAFKGGDLTAVMGGCEIDLRQAAIEGEAVIDVFAIWGGIEIRVPESWTVIGRVSPILGGFEDKTRPPHEVSTQRLVIRGIVIMGGVEVKN
jgi:predicted membrane protein